MDTEVAYGGPQRLLARAIDMASPERPLDLTLLPDRLRRLAERGDGKVFRKGHRLIQEGEFGGTLFIILSGRIRAFGTDDRDREVTYGTYGAGEYVGEISLDGGPRSASVEVIERCECVVVTRETLLRYIAECPEFALDLLAKVIRRVRVATLTTKQLALNDVYGRLQSLLNQLATAQPDGSRSIAERLTHKDLSTRLGCSREMVSRLLKDLEEGGYVRQVDGLLMLMKTLPTRW